MKKIFVVFLCFLAGGLAYWAWPEYGSGYSEEQRRLWNERRALYPVAWGLDGIASGSSRYRPFNNIAEITGWSVKEIERYVEEKKETESDIVGELEANRERLALDDKVFVSTDTSRLPLYGLSEKEVTERALAGDGDACLMMVISLGGDQFNGLSWRKRHEVNKWLDRAVAVKRSGAGFLKNLVIRSFEWPQSHLGTNGMVMLDNGEGMEKLPGYSEFTECLKRGDYLAYRAARGILPLVRELKEKKMVYKALLKGSRESRVECCRGFALMVFEGEKGYSFVQRIGKDVEEKKNNGEASLKWLPASWSSKIVTSLFSCGIIGAERTSSMKDYREATLCARRAAQQGDMTGMYLWLRYGIACMEYFSAAEWSDILAYDRILSETGYLPYIKRKSESTSEHKEALDNNILCSYYSRKSYEKWEGSDFVGPREAECKFSEKDSLGAVVEKIQGCCLTGQTDWFLDKVLTGPDFSSGGLLAGSSKEVRDYLLAQVEKWAEEGDIHAMYRMAGIYEKGIGVSVDLGRAHALYIKTLAAAEEFPLFRVRVKDGGDYVYAYVGLPMKQVVCLKIGYMVLNHSDFPGRNGKETYNLVSEASRHYLMKDYCCYILGQFHERGIGRPADREAALSFYKKGSSDNRDCRLAVDRLTAPEEEKKTERK